MYRKMTTWWLAGILLYYPFFTISLRYLKSEDGFLHTLARHIDEGTIVIFFLLLIGEIARNREHMNRLFLIVALPIVVFCIFGLISGVVNENPFTVTVLGTIDYVKYFLLIFIYAVHMRDMKAFHKIYLVLLTISVSMAMFALIEEVWSLVFRYVLGRDIMDPSVYLFRQPPPSAEASLGLWRIGIFRAASFMKSTNIFGYYMLFIFTIYLFMNRRLNPFIVAVLAGAVVFTVSRTACMGLLLVAVSLYLLRKTNRRRIIFLYVSVSLLLVFVLFSYVPDVDTLGNENVISYREFSMMKGMEIWRDYPLIGAGPGMFGGVVSKIFVSPMYNLYKFPFGYIKSLGGIDQFWPQVFAEIGLIGFILFLWIISSVIMILRRVGQSSESEDVKRLSQGLLVFLLVIYVYTFGTGFNTTAILYTYFAFFGMAVGAVTESGKGDNGQE